MFTHDIVIVGGGGAGLRAAIAAAEISNKLSIALVSKVYPMRSHTVSAEGGTAAVMRDFDSLDLHAKDTIFGADFLADQDAVEAFVQEAPGELIQLEHWGCPWSRDPDGRVSVRSFGGMSVEQVAGVLDISTRQVELDWRMARAWLFGHGGWARRTRSLTPVRSWRAAAWGV